MKRVMTYVLVGYLIRSKEFFGYSILDGLGVSKELYEYPGFNVLRQHMVESNLALSLWIKNHEARRLGEGPTIAELEASSASKDARISQLQKKYDIDMAALTTAKNAVIVQRD